MIIFHSVSKNYRIKSCLSNLRLKNKTRNKMKKREQAILKTKNTKNKNFKQANKAQIATNKEERA